MGKITKESYAEVDTILNLMDKKYVEQIPEKLRTLFKEKKAKNYSKVITVDRPLKEQNLNKGTLSILAALNYKYWCKDEKRKKELLYIYYKNGEKYKEELYKKYNSDNIFKKEVPKEILEEKKQNEIIVKENIISIFKKMMNKIKSFLK